jgi:redox-sensitive bicupin YhaK (pirin superfamily)
MLTIRKAGERGAANFGWLDSRHTFSFGNYNDPQHMGFGPLRVINEDKVQPGQGFGTHGHRDMEILSWVLEGALEHKDSMGTGAVIRPGEIQRMSAGTGVTHSEFNASRSDPVHFLQIWIIPDKTGYPPGYAQHQFDPADLANRWTLVASNAPTGKAVKINQDVNLYIARLDAGHELTHPTSTDRKLWLQVARGVAVLDGNRLIPGDGAAITSVDNVVVRAEQNCEVLLFDMTACFARSSLGSED